MPQRNGRRRAMKMLKAEKVIRSEIDAAVGIAQKNVAKVIADAAKRAKALTSARERRRVYEDLGTVYGELRDGLDAMMKKRYGQLALDMHGEAVDDMKAAGAKLSSAVTQFDPKRVEEIFSMVAPGNGSSLAAVATDKMEAVAVSNLRQSVVDVWRAADLEGKTLAERATMLQDSWESKAANALQSKFIDVSGREWDSEAYFDMLTRTTAARVSRDTYYDTLTKAGFDLSLIENVDDTACDICQKWDNKIVSITGRDKRFPSYADATRDGWGHPNCRCSAEYVDEDVDAELIAAQARR